MDNETAKVLAKVFDWAWRNDIHVAMFKYEPTYPFELCLVFTKGDRSMERKFKSWQDFKVSIRLHAYRIATELSAPLYIG